MRSTKPQTPSLKITAQYRDKRGMVYELESATGSPLDLHVWREVEEGAPEGWRVEAHDGHLANATVVGKSGATAAEALREVGRDWTTDQRRLAQFDWDAIAALLVTVRAI